jgi:hypothetical protein
VNESDARSAWELHDEFLAFGAESA